MGISVDKIRLIGRWMCGVVIHYTRTAPLNTLAIEYKRNRDEKNTTTTITNLTKTSAKLNKTLKAITDDYETKFADIQKIIKQMEVNAAPREFVTNRVTQKIHKILTRVEDVGRDAITYCGFKYAKASVSTHKEVPQDAKREHLCTTCLADLRAKTAKEVR